MPNFQERALEYMADPRPTAEVLALALSKDMEVDNEEFWLPIRVLQHRLPDEFQTILELSRSEIPKDQDLAATILGQNSVFENSTLWAVRLSSVKWYHSQIWTHRR